MAVFALVTYAAYAAKTDAPAKADVKAPVKVDAKAPVKVDAKAPVKVDAKKVAKPQTMCPVLSQKIDKKIFVDYKGKRIYFCCKACVDKFNKEPDKYVKILDKQGITLENAPVKKIEKPVK
jgi:YHS domain-containing protein